MNMHLRADSAPLDWLLIHERHTGITVVWQFLYWQPELAPDEPLVPVQQSITVPTKSQMKFSAT